MIYHGGAWPEEYRGQLFMSNIHGHRINVDLLEPEGHRLRRPPRPGLPAAPTTPGRRSLNLTLRPRRQRLHDRLVRQASSATSTTPDKHDRTNGRIYKISYNDAKPVKVDLQKLSDEELVKLARRTTTSGTSARAGGYLQERCKLRLEATSDVARQYLARLDKRHPINCSNAGMRAHFM